MQKTSALYKEILAGYHQAETRVAIGDAGVLIDKRGDSIMFGGTRILVGTSGAEDGYGIDMLSTVETSSAVFSGDEPSVGGVVSRECDITMRKPISNINGLERISIYTRITDGERVSEWLQQGVFFLDSMDVDVDEDDIQWITMHGYDALLFAEQDYPAQSNLNWPATDIDVVREIANTLGITIDQRTISAMTSQYSIQYSPTYSCREYLGYIAAMYAGCFVMSETGALQLVCFWDIPNETNYLADSTGYAITFGGDHIVV